MSAQVLPKAVFQEVKLSVCVCVFLCMWAHAGTSVGMKLKLMLGVLFNFSLHVFINGESLTESGPLGLQLL